MLLANVSDFLADAGAPTGGGAAIGAVAGFVGWLFRAPIRWFFVRHDEDDSSRAKVHDRLERMNGELEALVAAAIDEELDRLVAAELAERRDAFLHASRQAEWSVVNWVSLGCSPFTHH